MIPTLHQKLFGDPIKKKGIGRTCSTYEERRGTFWI